MYLLRVRIITNEEAAPKRAKKSIRAYTNPTSTVLGSQREGLIFSLPLCCQTSQLLASAPSTVCVVWSRGPAHGTHLRLRYVLRRSWLDVRFAFSRVAGDASFPISPFKLQPLRAASTGEVFAIARCESRLPVRPEPFANRAELQPLLV